MKRRHFLSAALLGLTAPRNMLRAAAPQPRSPHSLEMLRSMGNVGFGCVNPTAELHIVSAGIIGIGSIAPSPLLYALHDSPFQKAHPEIVRHPSAK